MPAETTPSPTRRGDDRDLLIADIADHLVDARALWLRARGTADGLDCVLASRTQAQLRSALRHLDAALKILD